MTLSEPRGCRLGEASVCEVTILDDDGDEATVAKKQDARKQKRAAHLARQATVDAALMEQALPLTDTAEHFQKSPDRTATATAPPMQLQLQLQLSHSQSASEANHQLMPPREGGSRSPPPSPLATVPLRPVPVAMFIPEPRPSPSESTHRASIARVPRAATASHARLRTLLVTPTELRRRQEAAERLGLNLSPPPRLPAFSRAWDPMARRAREGADGKVARRLAAIEH